MHGDMYSSDELLNQNATWAGATAFKATTLNSLINEQAKINMQDGKKFQPLIYLLSKSINKQGGIFSLLNEKLQAKWTF